MGVTSNKIMNAVLWMDFSAVSVIKVSVTAKYIVISLYRIKVWSSNDVWILTSTMLILSHISSTVCMQTITSTSWSHWDIVGNCTYILRAKETWWWYCFDSSTSLLTRTYGRFFNMKLDTNSILKLQFLPHALIFWELNGCKRKVIFHGNLYLFMKNQVSKYTSLKK